VQFRVRDRTALMAALSSAGIASSFCMGSTIVAPDTAMGATLVFA
jgi:predicted ATPase